jgi:hypothetical protein
VGCTVVGTGAFTGSGLKQIVIPSGCEIGGMAFMSCISLITVKLGTGCTTIECAAFSGCTALATVTLPPTLISIGAWAFGHCPALATLAIPNACRMQEYACHGSNTRVIGL